MVFNRFWLQFRGFARPLLVGAMVLALSGCGQEAQPDAGATNGEAGSREPKQRTSGNARAPKASARAGNGEAAGSDLVRTDADGRQWIEDIPLDVWFDEPLVNYGENAQVAASTAAAPSAIDDQPPEPSPAGGETPAPPAGSDASPSESANAWQELISATVLDAESKAVRNQLTAALRTVATYNSEFQSVQWDGAALCALAGIAIEHPEPLSWKDKAPHIRDLSQKIEESAQERGRPAFQATQAAYEQLVAVMSGNEPAGLEPAEPSVPFAQSASRGGIMRRMQESFDWLNKNINSAERLQDAGNKDQIVLESSLLAALTKVISLEGYDSADEPDYGQEAKSLVQDALDARSAAEAGSYDAFREAVDRMGTRCNTCHATYRFE